MDLPRGVGNTVGGTGSDLLGRTTGCSSGVLLFLRFFGSLGIGNGLSVLLVLVDGPIEDIVVLEAFTDEKITEDLSEIGIVWLVVETKRSSIVEIDGKLVGESTAEDFSWSCHLLLHDSVVLLLLCGSFQTLPWKRATAEVEHNIAKGFHIITTRLLCV
jgi:hypothetical protein